MPRPKTPEQLAELQHLREWCLTLTRYVLGPSQNRLDIPNLQAILDEGLRKAEADIDDMVARGQLARLRLVAREIERSLGEVSRWGHDEELDAMLREKFGRGLRDMRQMVDGEIARVLKRGFIKTEDEFRVVRNAVSDVDFMTGDDEEIARRRRLEDMLGVVEGNGFPSSTRRKRNSPS